MIWPGLAAYGDWALLALRLLVAAIFFTSGLSHARDPKKRGASIGMGPAFTALLGVAEMAGALGVASGILIQPAAIGLILVMLGAIQKKIFVWKTGLWERVFGVALRPDARRHELRLRNARRRPPDDRLTAAAPNNLGGKDP